MLLFKRFIVHRTWRKSFKNFFHPSRDYYCHIFFRVVILLLTSKLFDFETYLKITTREKRCTFDLLAPCDFVRQKDFEIIRNFARQSSFRKSRRARTFFKLNVKLSRVSFLISEESSRFAFESAYAKCFIQFFLFCEVVFARNMLHNSQIYTRFLFINKCKIVKFQSVSDFASKFKIWPISYFFALIPIL